MRARRWARLAAFVAVPALVLGALGWALASDGGSGQVRRSPAAFSSARSPLRATIAGTRFRDGDIAGRTRHLRSEAATSGPAAAVGGPASWSLATIVAASTPSARSDALPHPRGPPLLLSS